MTHEQLSEYVSEQVEKHPNLKTEIEDFYNLYLTEMEEGGSPENERLLCYNSIEELIQEL
jgi:hypothetical protein